MTELPSKRPSRAEIEVVAPLVDDGRFPAKATVAEPVTVVADVFADGHDVVVAALRWRSTSPEPSEWSEAPMAFVGNDRWTGRFVPGTIGRWEYELHAWVDHAESWRRGTLKKLDADLDVAVELVDGEQLIEPILKRAIDTGADDDVAVLRALADSLGRGDGSRLDDQRLPDVFWRHGPRTPTATTARPLPIDVDPERARFSSWYEFFPRSTVDPEEGHGTLRSAIDRLDHVAAMGFDVVYLPPIHPIGSTHRKGANNTTTPGPDDVGSPWGIGGPTGGHTAVHPDLGTVDDVVALVEACEARGMQLAMDVAFQCSPDHPWVTEQPEWFEHRSDGTIQYAENPPKKYQDIYPLDFDTADWEALWTALADVFRFWIERGVKIFRVDNPHTKSFAFWEWALRTLRAEHPDTIYLAEAFTRPRVMERLAKIGFNQSYTYFAWRQSSWELREYFTDLGTRTVDYFRPNAWPNTPDILTEQLQTGGRPAFVSRAILAATLSPSWGVYGPAFELQEHLPVRDGSEEYLDSEKYQLRRWDLDRDDSLAPLLRRLNEIRRDHPALQHLRTIWFHETDNPALLCFSKTDPSGVGDPILVVANLDPSGAHSGHVDVDLARIGLPYGTEYDLVDVLGGGTYTWAANRNYVELSPWSANAHVFSVRPR